MTLIEVIKVWFYAFNDIFLKKIDACYCGNYLYDYICGINS